MVLSTAVTLALVGGTVDVLNDAGWGLPAGALPGSNVQDVHGVDFLEGAALGFVDEEEDDEDTGKAASGEDVAVGEVDRAGDEGGEERDQEVPCPVRSGCNANRHGTVTSRVHFGAN